jgi:hypothetical protein
MKGRAFAAVVLSALLLLSGLGIGGWWLLWQRGPLQLAHHRLAMPRAARFVPASASFSLYLFSDGQRPVDYARAVAPARQRRPAGEAIARLRDGAFAAAGLDYQDELAGWLGGDIAMALFEDPVAAAAGGAPEQPTRGWLLALASRDDDGARRFLQRFWQTRSLAGTDLQVSRYRGMGLISGRGALLGSRPEPLATALVDDDLVLIASGRNLLERALDVSQIPELNQAGQPLLRQGVASFGSGAALAVASPEALHSWLGLPAPEPGPGAAVDDPMGDPMGTQVGTPVALLSEAAAAARGLPRTAALAAALPEGPEPEGPEPDGAVAEVPAGSAPSGTAGAAAASEDAAADDSGAQRRPATGAPADRLAPERSPVGGRPPEGAAPDVRAELQRAATPPPLPADPSEEQARRQDSAPLAPEPQSPAPAPATALLSPEPKRPAPLPAPTPSPTPAPTPPGRRDGSSGPGAAAAGPSSASPSGAAAPGSRTGPSAPPSRRAETPASLGVAKGSASPVTSAAAPPAAVPPPSGPSAPSLLAVLQPQGRQLELRARLLLPRAPRLTPMQPELAEALLAALRGSPSSLALIEDPAALGDEPLLRPLLERSLGLRPQAAAERQGPLPALLASSIHGPLLASQASMGWQLVTRPGDPAASDLEPRLREAGLLEAPLALDDHQLRVWTHLSLPGRSGRRDRSGADALLAPLAGWSEQRPELAWWGQTLATLEAPAESRSLTALRRGLRELGAPAASLQWSLDGDGARALLRSWQPWRLLSALAGGGLDGPVRGLALALDSPAEVSALELRARLNLGD